LEEIRDPYSLAICAYSLYVADSTKKELAYNLLHKIRIEAGKEKITISSRIISHQIEKKTTDSFLFLAAAEFIYWSPEVVPINGETYENQRPFIQPKNNEFWDAMAVEATSYALLVYLIRDGVTPIPESIVAWLNTMRLTDGGFISSIVSFFLLPMAII